MKKVINQIMLHAKQAGKIYLNRNVTRRFVSVIIAVSVILSLFTPELTVLAADKDSMNETIEVTSSEQTVSENTDAVIPVEVTLPDLSDDAVDEPVILKNDEDIDVSVPSDFIDSTAPPAEQPEETYSDTVEASTDITKPTTEPSQNAEKSMNNIVTAHSADEYFKLIAELPEGYQRIIVDTTADLSSLVCSAGVYYDGTYIIVFDDADTTVKAVKLCEDERYEYALDGTLGVCGDVDKVSGAQINPNAKVKVAVIDTGSNLANEYYSVIGDDAADRNGHGTAMSSFILNETDDAYIISIKALGNEGKGNMSDVYAAVQLAEEIGVDYILLAISIRNIGQYDAFVSLIENTKAQVVASAGNNGADAVKYLPAGINGVITIGALNSDGTKASFSNYGNSVDYYVFADSTSEAAALALGTIIDGRKEELSTCYAESSYIEEPDDSFTATLFAVAEDDEVFTTNATITVYNIAGINQSSVIRGGPNFGNGVFSKSSTQNWPNTSNANLLYCCEATKAGPVSVPYDSTSLSGTALQTAQAACAFGPSGALYAYGIGWWKQHYSNLIIGSDKDFMYIVTHYVICACWGYTGNTYYWDVDQLPSTMIWETNSGLAGPLIEYRQYISSKRNRSTISESYVENGKTYYLKDWEASFYKPSNDDQYQVVARGNVTKYVPTTVDFTIDKASTDPLDTGYLGFAGATYKLYREFEHFELSSTTREYVYELRDADLIKTFVIEADGTTSTRYSTTITSGTYYYLKETSAAPGFELDDTIYWIYVANDGTVSVGVMESYTTSGGSSIIGGGQQTVTRWRPVTDATKVTVTNGTIDVVHVKDTPKALFKLDKKLGSNYTLLAGQIYSFELWDNTAGVKVANGTATIPSGSTNSSTTAVVWSGIASGYESTTENKLILIPSHAYQVMETTLIMNGLTLKTPTGWTSGNAHGKNCFYQTFTPSVGSVNSFTVTNDTEVAYVAANKKLGTNYKDLAGQTYSFELWDNTDNVKVANGTATVPSTANSSTTTPVIWSSIANGYSSATNNRIQVKTGHSYQLLETTLTVNGWSLDTPSSWTKGIVHGKNCFYQTAFIANAGQTHTIAITNNLSKVDISLTKASTNPGITGSNTCYNLNGTTYGLYSTQTDANANTNRLATFTVNASGVTTTKHTSEYSKTYYLKEITAGQGYQKDNNLYTVTVSSTGVVSVDKNVKTTKTGDVYYMNMTDRPNSDPLKISLRKVDKAGNVVHNATFTGAKFRISYYAQDLGATGNNNATATVIYEYTLNGSFATISLADLKALTPVGGSDQNYLKNLPASWDAYPFGTVRIQEIQAPVGYMLNDQVIRIRLLADGTTPRYVENNSSYGTGNRNYWNQLADGTMQLTEQPTVGYYSLTKSLDDTTIRSSVAGFEYELYNTSSQATPTLIATGVSQTDGRVLWTYKVANYYSNTDNTKLLTNTTTYNLELPATERNASGTEVAVQYQVRERKSSIAIAYGNSGIPYTYSTPTTNGTAWSNANDYFYKAVTVSNSTAVKQEGVVNNYEYTGLSVNKVIPTGNPFDMTKVTFRLYNTDGSDTLIATGSVDSKGNVTWHRSATSGYGSTPATSVNVFNNIPLGHYRVEETWDKTYIDVSSSVRIQIEETNNSGWTKTETATSYTYSKTVDLSAKSNDGKVTSLAVENSENVQKFNLTKIVTVAGDASAVTAQLYKVNGGTETLVATGTAKTNGVGTYGFTWTYAGNHTTENGIDTLVLPVGSYRVVEICPTTYYKSTQVPYTYKTPDGYTARTVGGLLQFYKDFTLSKGEFVTLESSVENVRIEGSFDIIKIERSGTSSAKTFTFEVYYRGNGAAVSTTSTLIETVTITTSNGKGTASLTKLPEGWYEIREVGTASTWTTHWYNASTVTNGNKVVRLDSSNRTNAAPVVNDGVTSGGTAVNAVLVYNDVAPSIGTTLVDRGSGDHVTTCSAVAVLEDTVVYKNLQSGHYVVTGVLMDKNTGNALIDKSGKPIIGEAAFDVAAVKDAYGEAIPQSGTVKVTYTLDTTVLEGVTLVAFETLHQGTSTGSVVTKHENLNDVNQTVYIPKIGTTLVDSRTKESISSCSATAKLVDTVNYENLIPGKGYTLTGTLYNKATGKSIGVTATKKFTPTAANGSVEVEFTIDTTAIKGVSVVAFETMSYNGADIAIHANINDVKQTLNIPDIGTTLVSSKTSDHIAAYEKNTTLVDTITYKNLVPNKEYMVTGELYNKATGKSIDITASKKFTPTTADGSTTLEFTVDTTKIKGIKTVAFETVSYNGVDVAVHADINDVKQTVDIPDVETTLKDSATIEHVSAYSKTTKLVDTVDYKNLIPNKDYILTGTLYNKATGKSIVNADGNAITVSKMFRPTTASGTVTLEFTVDTTLIKGISAVAFETVTYNGIEVAVHADINDEGQTVEIPEIETSFVDNKTNEHISSYAKTAQLVDTVTYTHLLPGKEYTITGTIMDKTTGKELKDLNGGTYVKSKTFTPTTANGTIEIEFVVDTTVIKGVTTVAFETIKYNGVTIAVHTDINDALQTLDIPDIQTTAKDKATGDKVVGYNTKETLVDTVKFTNLIPGKSYTVSGTLVNKKTGKTIVDADGKAIAASKTFTAESAAGSVDIEFTFDSSVLAGETIVAFETLTYNNIDVAVHADINDKEQTVFVPEIHTTFVDSETKEHVSAYDKTAKLVDTVTYSNLVTGKEYTVTGKLMNKVTGKELLDADGNTYVASKTFTADNTSGTVDIEFTVDTTVIKDVTIVAFEELYHNSILVAVHSDINDVDQTIYIPDLKTTLKDVVTDDHVAAEDTVELVDSIKYSNLLPGKEYTVTGTLMNQKTGEKMLDENGNAITASTIFTATSATGSVDITFKFSAGLLKGTTVVAFENLDYNKIKVATHADISDEEQTEFFPEIHTTLFDDVTAEHVSAQSDTIKLIDTVAYSNLKPDYEYTITGTLMDKETGSELLDKDDKTIVSSVTFTPATPSGYVEVVFEFDGSLLKGETLVAFEKCEYKGKTVATHNDITDVDQTVEIPDVHTTFFDKDIGEAEDFVRADKDVTLVDRVYYENIRPGLEYTLYGAVMVKETGDPFLDADGNAVVMEKKFTPDSEDGYVDVEFVVDTTLVAGKTLVAFETLEYNGVTLVIHADINDVDQTVYVPDVHTTATDKDNKTHTLTYKERVTVVDKVIYDNLIPGRTYTVTGTLYNAETSEVYKDPEGKTYTASAEFTPAETSGSVDVVFENVLVPYTYTKAVVFEDLYDKTTGVKIATHSDITDEDQTFERPVVGTTATIDGNKEIWLASTEVRNLTITDTISYTSLEIGILYRAEATLYKADGTQILVGGQPIKSIHEFTPTAKDGTVNVSITFSTEGLSEGDKIVVFEKVYDVATEAEKASGTQAYDLLIARHEDLTDSDQTVTIHFRPSTGEINPTYRWFGVGLIALSALAAFINWKKKRTPVQA